MTSSPSSNSAHETLYRLCFAPHETMISFFSYTRLLSFLNFSIIAAFNSSVPPTGVYFVNPSLIALIAASLIFSGVSKSGSPTPKFMTSTPPALRDFTLASSESVGEGLIDNALFDSLIVS